jgi:hypothetical protein
MCNYLGSNLKGTKMKLKALILLSLFSFNSFANTTLNNDMDILSEDESFEVPRMKVKDVKEILSQMDPDKTCIDEYLKRRKQLILKLSISPVTIVGGTYASFFAGAIGGLGVAYVVGATGWDPLGYVILGGFAGVVGTGVTTVTDTGLTVFQLIDVDMILKALAEQRSQRPGAKSDKLFSKYLKGNENPLTKELFFEKLKELDESGELCDGSLVKRPRIGTGRRLKYKIARTKHLRKHL